MGEIELGSVVFDQRGQQCQVTFVSNVMHDRPCHRVVFSDGTVIVADGEHQWLTWTRRARMNAARNQVEGAAHARPAVVTTDCIRRTLVYRQQLNHSVRVASALQVSDLALPIDPHVFGVWLGDGTSTSCHVTCVDEEILQEIRSAGYGVEFIQSALRSGRAPYYAIGKAPEQRDPVTGRMVGNGSLTSRLRDLGVLGNKHIPMRYLRASAAQRIALLQGLLDTDGYVDQYGKCEFYNTNARLADDVYELCGTLGLKCSRRKKAAMLNGVRCGTVHIVAFTPYVPDMPVFRLPRKLNRLHAPGAQAQRQRMRYIVAVDPCPSVPVRCIQVDAPSHLYLVSRAFIATHNTYAGAVRSILRSQQQPGSLGLIGAPTYPMLRDVTQRTLFELCPQSLIASFSKTEQHLVMRNGSEILLRSLDDPDRVRGLNLAWFWLDEAPLSGYYAWKVLKGRLRQRGFETAGWATGTPHGRDGYAQDFEIAMRPGHALYRANTFENLRNLPRSFIEDLGYTGQFYLQEVEGRFVAFEGLVYFFEADAADGNVRVWSGESCDFKRVIGGIGWGYTNPCAALVFGLDGDERAWELEEFYQRRAGLDEVIIPAVVELSRKHGVAVWYCDAEDPEAIARLSVALAREGLQTRALAVQKGPGSVRAACGRASRR